MDEKLQIDDNLLKIAVRCGFAKELLVQTKQTQNEHVKLVVADKEFAQKFATQLGVQMFYKLLQENKIDIAAYLNEGKIENDMSLQILLQSGTDFASFVQTKGL